WGRRQFAFLINKKEYGYYAVMNVVAAGGALDDFERSLRIADDVVRHKLLRLPDAEAARRGMTAAA
ncbi:MAG: 30S ribosomal protein S6, partial [Actinomycetota bacterium]